jgi:hypothetical protein
MAKHRAAAARPKGDKSLKDKDSFREETRLRSTLKSLALLRVFGRDGAAARKSLIFEKELAKRIRGARTTGKEKAD